MGDCISPATLSDIAQRDTQRLIGSVAKCLAANSPFIGLLDGGVFPSGVSDEVRTAVQMPACPGDSLAVPTFSNDTDYCGHVGLQDKTGAINYTFRLETKRGFGPRVCVKKGYSAFKTSYSRAEDSLTKLITQYINADIKAQLYLRSASKFVNACGYCFEDLFTGGDFPNINVLFAQVLPTGPLSFKTLHYLARVLKERLWADMWPANGEGMEHYRFIGSSDAIELMRNEVGVTAIMMGLAAGQYQLGELSLAGYSWEQATAYRGLAFAVDQTPLRASGFNEDGTLALINPRICVTDEDTNTAYSVHNPAWLDAEYEVGFLVGMGSFRRLVPERYVGEGTFRFAPQLVAGELDWHYEIDNDCNVWGDYGWHKYQIVRAYEPVRPHHIIPILYKRCPADLGCEPCESTSCTSLSSLDDEEENQGR